MMKISHDYKFETKKNRIKNKVNKKELQRKYTAHLFIVKHIFPLWTVSLDQSVKEVQPGATGKRAATPGA